MPITPIIDRVMVICTSAVVQDVVLNKLVQGETYTWHKITGIDRDTRVTTIEVGLKYGGEFFAYRCAGTADPDRSVGIPGRVVAPGEFVPCARFKVARVGDRLELVVNGHAGAI